MTTTTTVTARGHSNMTKCTSVGAENKVQQ